MIQTQVSLDPETLKEARRKASELGISFAEYVRRLLAKDLSEKPTTSDPTAVFNLGKSGNSDIRREKNRAIREAVDAHRRSRSQ